MFSQGQAALCGGAGPGAAGGQWEAAEAGRDSEENSLRPPGAGLGEVTVSPRPSDQGLPGDLPVQ